MVATSSGLANRFSNEDGRTERKISLRIPMKVDSDSDLIPVTCSEVKAVVFGAKRRWRSYGA